MEALLCDEVWLMSPPITFNDQHDQQSKQLYSEKNCISTSAMATKEDCENTLKFYLQKELKYMPSSRYVELLESSHSISTARFKAIRWLFQSQRCFALLFGTIFNAANYYDRFVSMNQCNGWKCWMFELLSVACLSIASKFDETAPPHFHQMQEGLDYLFESSLIQRMELIVLKAIGWGLNCVTPYSYVELMTREMNDDISIKPYIVEEITSQLIELLANSLLGYRLLALRPCIIALTGLKRLLGKELLIPSTRDAHINHITSFIPQNQKENMIKCDKLFMAETSDKKVDKLYLYVQSSACHPTSPVTVLTKARVEISDQQVDFALFKMQESLNGVSLIKRVKKRKRDEN